MKDDLILLLCGIFVSLGIKDAKISLEYPENSDHGDFSTNAALAYAKELKTSPKALAEKIVSGIKNSLPDYVESVETAGAGFINFKIKSKVIAEKVVEIAAGGLVKEPKSSTKKVMIEYTDPNTFKVFHIGHLMSNAIGESLSRLIEFSGSKVVRMCYPSDIGLHIAKSVWAIDKNSRDFPKDSVSIQEKTAFLGKMYVEGTKVYDADPNTKAEIDRINRVLYDKTDKNANGIFLKGRQWSLEHFELLYKILGTHFDEVIYESEMAPIGLELVRTDKNNVFEKSEGAVVFKGEKFGLHTRVFVNSQGLPTYEAKELGLNITKFEKHPDAKMSIVITASEQNDYFKVLAKVLALIDEKDGSKLKHIGHGMMRFADGKMSSRTGNVITADSLISDLKEMALTKMADRKFSDSDADLIAEQIAVAAIKYTVLRSSVGSDIVFDSIASVSFEGDSGPYLQYSAVRANSVLEKAKDFNKNAASKILLPEKVGLLERLLVRFPDVAIRAAQEFSPQQVAGYLINLAGAFNAYYGTTQIIDEKDPFSSYRLALTEAFIATMTKGLWLLGIKVPQKM
ncbi:MAG: arginine--tRNA ligase [Candidatus Taylorbacteria bacterium]|nr:arginine--tRNA ligase [Candidatus Taylorbacteria bacterium]